MPVTSEDAAAPAAGPSSRAHGRETQLVRHASRSADSQERRDEEADEPPAVEGPKAENAKANAGDTKLTAEEIAGDQGIAGSRTGSRDPARLSVR